MARYHVRQIALDGNDLDAMVAFWTAALGYELDHREEGYAVLRDPGGSEPRIFLQKVPEPKAGSEERAHFDVAAPDRRASARGRYKYSMAAAVGYEEPGRGGAGVAYVSGRRTGRCGPWRGSGPQPG
jgi:catechol 2,3-dioxygenase-like lactoylglutathione lyase family enzyme